MGKQRIDIKYRFLRKIEKQNDPNKCWGWLGSKTYQGYGRIHSVKNNKSIPAHRVSWEIYYGEIPKGYFICHKCDNPSCVNPRHLFMGTQKDNIQDARSKGRLKGFQNMNEVSRAKAILNSKITNANKHNERMAFIKKEAYELFKELESV